MSWFWPFKKNTASANSKRPLMSMSALPIDINPPQRRIMQRHAGRMSNLFNVLERGDTRPDVISEIERRSNELAIAGFPVPASEAQARELMANLTEDNS